MQTKGTAADLWRASAEAWERLFEPKRAPLFDAIVDATAIAPGMSVLDAGCGGGGVALRAAQAGARITGCDIAEGMVALAQRKVPQGAFHVADLAALPYDDDRFDVVIACDCLALAGRPDRALAELARVCKPDGGLAIAVWEGIETSAYSRVFAAMEALLPSPPAITPLALSAPGALHGMIARARLSVRDDRRVALDYAFAAFDEYWRAARAMGGVKGLIGAVGEAAVREAARRAAEPSITVSGALVMRHVYRLTSAFRGAR